MNNDTLAKIKAPRQPRITQWLLLNASAKKQMPPPRTKRIEWIDIAKALGILLVSFGHLRNGDGQSVWLPALDSLIDGIYLFHMPLFFLLGGLTFSTRGGFKAFLIRKIRTLLIPYYVFSLYFLAKPVAILLIPNLRASFQTSHDYGVAHQFYDVLIAGNGLWFLMAFFVAELVTYGITKYAINSPLKIVIGTILIVSTFAWTSFGLPDIMPFQIMKGIQISGFMLLGIVTKNTWLYMTKRTAVITMVPAILIVAICQIVIRQKLLIDDPLFHTFILIFAAFTGAVGFICFAIAIHQCQWLSQIGQDSIVYYALNALTLNVAKILVFRILGIDATHLPYISQLIIGTLTTALAIALLTAENIIIQRWLWWTIGKSHQK